MYQNAGIRRTIRGALFVVLLLGLSGCSSTRLLYDNADWLALRWAGRLVDASRAQKEAWREPFAAMLVEHRRDLLPDVVLLLQLIEQEIRRGLDADRLECLLQGTNRLYTQHAELATGLGVRVLGGLTAGQVRSLSDSLEERNRDYRDDYLDPDPVVRSAKRAERYLERIERWTGDLSTAQLRLTERAIAGMPDVAADWLAYRQQQQQRLLALLRNGANEQVLRDFLSRWWVDLADRPPQLRQQRDRLQAAGIRLAIDLDKTFSPAQRAGFAANVAALRASLEAAQKSPREASPLQQQVLQCSATPADGATASS